LKNGILTVSGEKKEEKKEDTDKFHRVERVYGKFSRSLAGNTLKHHSSSTSNYV
jgi:HSP20 family molecular chaperone IbpA